MEWEEMIPDELMMLYDSDETLQHYGMPRRSGRYPHGSGENPHQHCSDFVGRVQDLRSKGLSEKEVATALGCKNTSDFRVQYSRAVNELRGDRIARARSLKEDGLSNAEVARRMGINESTLRSLLNEYSEARTNAAQKTADFLRQQVNEKGMIDVGAGVERELNISKEKLQQAIKILEEEGYVWYGGGVSQVTNPGKQTNIKVLCPPGTEHKEIYNFDKVHTITDYIQRYDENGKEYYEKKFEYPASMDSSRLQIRYRDDVAPDGHTGVEKDGTVEIRRGVKDLDLGESHYAQVRIMVDNDKYIKGMAFYSDDMPDGVDVIFNTNKTREQADNVLKPIKKDDPNNPFGSLLREEGGQYKYTDENGERKLGLINKTRQEGDWGEWADKLPAQFLSKQSMKLIDRQLGLSKQDKELEFEDICSLTNPTVKKQLLESFANDCDAASVHLKAAALPRQKYQVILPVATLNDNEVYAPRYKDGETVALIRYPHGGTFEIPILKVNNKHPDARKIIDPSAVDAVGINAKVAERLSGADFDGDTVMVVPCNSSTSNIKIASRPQLEGLKGFDPKMEYPERPGMKYMKYTREDGTVVDHTQKEMGVISNLITDMTLNGATTSELARAVRHSMVVIDAAKHKLDYKLSEERNGIAALKKRYQIHVDEDGVEHVGGASTLISLAKSKVQVLKRKGQPHINEKGKEWYDPSKPEGALVYKEVVEEYVDKQGKRKIRMQDSTRMAETNDANTLSSGTEQEKAYAEYANAMKDLANKARLEYAHTGRIEYSASAAKTYRDEVNKLDAQLNLSLLNAPRERQAQLAANSEIEAMKKDNPNMTSGEKKKFGQQALARARARYGASRHVIDISPKGWEAIQAGAITETTLKSILRFADIDQVRSYATPRTVKQLTPGKQARINALRASGYTVSQIATAIGVSTSTVANYLNGKE